MSGSKPMYILGNGVIIDFSKFDSIRVVDVGDGFSLMACGNQTVSLGKYESYEDAMNALSNLYKNIKGEKADCF